MRKYVLMTVMALSMTVYANQDGGARLIDYVNPFVGTRRTTAMYIRARRFLSEEYR